MFEALVVLGLLVALAGSSYILFRQLQQARPQPQPLGVEVGPQTLIDQAGPTQFGKPVTLFFPCDEPTCPVVIDFRKGKPSPVILIHRGRMECNSTQVQVYCPEHQPVGDIELRYIYVRPDGTQDVDDRRFFSLDEGYFRDLASHDVPGEYSEGDPLELTPIGDGRCTNCGERTEPTTCANCNKTASSKK